MWACALALANAASGSGNPVFWPLGYAEHQVFLKYKPQLVDLDVSCSPVGPYARSQGSELFGEFACDVQSAGGEEVLAVVPTGAKTFKELLRGQPSPVSGPLRGIAGAGAAQHVALLDYPVKHAVVLGDQSAWKLADPTGRLANWKHGDTVTVQPARTKAHLYRVVNKTRGNELEADFLGFA